MIDTWSLRIKSRPDPDRHCVQRRSDARRGFVLMATLWIVLAVAVMVLAANAAAHALALGARNRTNQRIAYWRAMGCVARTRSRLDEALAATDRPQAIWDSLDSHLAADDQCRVTAAPIGLTLDINHVSEPALRTTLQAAGLLPAQVDSVVHVISPPRAVPFSSWEAMRAQGGGILHALGVDSLFGVDTDRVYMGRAPPAVVLGAGVDARMRDSIPSHGGPAPGGQAGPSRTLPVSLTPGPEAWWIRAEAARGDPPTAAVVGIRAILLGRRLAIQDVRLW